MSIADGSARERLVAVRVAGVERRVYCRERGAVAGPVLVFLHGGWGYEMYPFDAVLGALAGEWRVLIPDRSGWGRSGTAELTPGFHADAARETLALLDALGIERAALWGHSDGAVVAALAGLEAPQRCSALVLEALHFDRCKPASRAFFTAMVLAPESFGRRACEALARDHGARWREVLSAEGRAWLEILDTCSDPARDLYAGRLGELRVTTLLLHGARDPRTEPGEWVAIRALLPDAGVALLPRGGHSPHSEPEVCGHACAAAARFLAGVRSIAARA